MLYSKRGTLYDSSDQSEHRSSDPGDDPMPRNDPQQPPPGPAARAEEPPDEQRWDNEGGEGGGRREETASPSFVFAGDLTAKPAWSVLSLAELNEAIRRETEAIRRETRAEAARPAPPRVAPPATPGRPEPAREGNAWEYAYEPPPPPDSSVAPGTHA